MLLAGDVGGTKTLLGLFDATRPRPRPLVTRAFTTLDFEDLSPMIAAFLQAEGSTTPPIHAACFGVAGPVNGDTADLTNVPWRVDARRIASSLGVNRVRLLNDLEAMAYSVPVLQPSEVHVLQEGTAIAGNIAILAAGTGLGESMLHHVNEQLIPSPSEGGHADFAARTDREVALMRDLTARFGRAEVEHVLSGPGLVNIHRALCSAGCSAGVNLEDPGAPAAISAAALAGAGRCCVDTLDLFVEAYGAEAGNLALRTVSTGGVFVGGGIAPKILPALTTGAFMRAFRAKAPFEALLDRVPVKVIVNDRTGLLGAAVCAASQL